MSAIKAIGWDEYIDWGAPYFEWKFTEDVEALGAKKDDVLHRRRGGKGDWQLRPQKGKRVALDEKAVADALFNGRVPPWRPPRTDTEILDDALRQVVAAIDRLADATKLNGTRATPSTTKEPSQSKPDPKLANKYVRLKFNGEYDNGEAYRDWELLVDAPWIPAARDTTATPPHAIAGDVLREEPHDELTPWQLRRGGRRIGDPEWWQVRNLFTGMAGAMTAAGPEDPDPSPGPTAPRDPMERAHALIPEKDHECATLILADIPDAGLLAGDVVVCWRKPACAGIGRSLPMDTYHALRTLNDAGRLREALAPLDPDRYARSSLESVIRDKKKWGLRRKTWTSDLYLVRPVAREGVSEPVVAASTDGAIWTLLHDIGCTLPKGGDDDKA